MKLLDCQIYRSLLKQVTQQVPVSSLAHRRILITGASGLIGSAIVDLLLFLNQTQQADIHIVAVGRDCGRLHERFGDDSYLTFLDYRDLLQGKGYDEVDDYVLAASPASPNLFIQDPESVVRTNTSDLETILTGIEAGCGKRVLYVSSSEVYGDALAPRGGHVEENLGKLNEDDVRSCYPRSKRLAEEICRRFEALQIRIVRPGHIYGPTALPTDRRVSSCWAYDVAAGRDIVMKSEGRQIRSYTHCLDCASAILTVLGRGSARAYNISNRDSIMTIRELAEIFTESGRTRLFFDVPSAHEQIAFNQMQNSSLNSTRLQELGWKAEVDARYGLFSTVQLLKLLKKV